MPLRALFCVHSHQRSHLLLSPCFVVKFFPVLSPPYSLLSATCPFLSFQHRVSVSPIHFCFSFICSQSGWQQLFIPNHSLCLQSTSHDSSVLVSPNFSSLLCLFVSLCLPFCVSGSRSLCSSECYFQTEPKSSEALGDQGEIHIDRTTHTQTQNTKVVYLSHLQMLCLEKCQILNS